MENIPAIWERQAASVSSSGSGSTGIDTASVYAVLATALPSSLIAEALTNSNAVASQIASEFSAGSTPAWFTALPTGIQSYLLGAAATAIATSSVPPPPSDSSNVPPPPPSSHSSDQSTQIIQSSTHSSSPTSSAPSPSSMSQLSETSSSMSPATTSSNTLSALFTDTNASVTAGATTTSSSSNGTPTGAIAGGVVGGVAGLALIGVGAAFLLRRRKRQQRIEPMREVSIHPGGGSQGWRDF